MKEVIRWCEVIGQILKSWIDVSLSLFAEQGAMLARHWDGGPQWKQVLIAALALVLVLGFLYGFWHLHRLLVFMASALFSVLALFFVAGLGFALINIILRLAPATSVALR